MKRSLRVERIPHLSITKPDDITFARGRLRSRQASFVNQLTLGFNGLHTRNANAKQ